MIIGENMKKLFAKLDKPLLIMTILYSILGLIMIFSASSISAVVRYNQNSSYFFIRQALFIFAGFFIGFVFVLRMPTSKYKVFVPLLLIGIIASLIGLRMYGQISNGAQSWYKLGPINIQPTEFAKSVVIIYLAVFFNAQIKKKQSKPLAFIKPLSICVVIFALILLQPDLGGALIVGGIVFFIFFGIPMRRNNKAVFVKVLGIGAIIAGIAVMYFGNNLLSDYQLSRLQFKEPCTRYMEETGYQVCNGFIAIHNGGLTGVGLGNSTQKYLYLPEAHTDFIFAIIIEELGLIVSIMIILGYAYMLYRILKISKEAETLRGSILCYGTFLFLLLHILINLLGILALIPLTGVPLPLLSYGGSFNLNVLFMLFVVQRVAIENKTLKNKREIEAL